MGKEASQRQKDIPFLLAAGGNHRLQTDICSRPVVGAKAIAHFLLDFGRAQVPFRRVIGERHPLPRRKSQNRTLVFSQTMRIVPRGLFGQLLSALRLDGGSSISAWLRFADTVIVPPGQHPRAGRLFPAFVRLQK